MFSRVFTASLALLGSMAGVLAGCATFQAGWSVLQVQWRPTAAANGTIEVNEGLASAFVNPKELGGRWLRVTAKTAAENPNFNIWIQMLDKDVRPYVRPLPTVCTVAAGERVCVNSAWVDPAADRVRIALASFGKPTTVTSTVVEVGSNSTQTRATVANFEELAKNIQSLYYKRDETDWTKAATDAHLALSSPQDIDPLPEAVALLLAHLPESRHSSISLNGQVHNNPGLGVLPSCVVLPNGVHRLDLPGTAGTSSEEYISKAHRCLENGAATRWLINLTEDNGGDSFEQFGALQPIFGIGDQMEMRGAGGGVFPVNLSATVAALDGRPQARWQATSVEIPPDKITFIAGPGCASACEALLIAAKGRFNIIGQPSAGFTTSNEGVAINNQFTANVTSGYMTKLGGLYSARIQPDVLLDDARMEMALKTGAYE